MRAHDSIQYKLIHVTAQLRIIQKGDQIQLRWDIDYVDISQVPSKHYYDIVYWVLVQSLLDNHVVTSVKCVDNHSVTRQSSN